jgi:hypothetical protein
LSKGGFQRKVGLRAEEFRSPIELFGSARRVKEISPCGCNDRALKSCGLGMPLSDVNGQINGTKRSISVKVIVAMKLGWGEG